MMHRPLTPPVRCLIVDEMHESILPLLTSIGVVGDYQPDLPAINVATVLAEGGYDGLVVRSKLFISEEIVRAAPSLRFICRAGAGTDNLDEGALAAAGIHLINAPEGNREAVGEFAVGLLLALLRNIPRADREVRTRQWHREANRGIELASLTVGIIGFGNMGAAFAQKLSGFGCRILAHDLLPEKINLSLARAVSLEQLQTEADVISLHVPLTPRTRRLVDADWLARCARPLWLLNLSRGEIVDTHALVEALQAGRLQGAALDVLENERLASLSPEQASDFDYLCQHPQIVFTPHIGGWTTDSYKRINHVLTSKLARFINGG
jgi:D-3-phosphoglycerate dehydrogenase / 2-oxoglutarate reductase